MDSEELPRAEETVEEPKTIEETEGEKPETNEPKLARVEYDYEARDSDELSLSKGDVITVMEQGEEGWWKGDLNGKIGLFPENHVKLIEASSQLAEDDEDAENPGGKKKKTLNKYGVKPGGIGSLFAEGKFPSLKKRSLESSSVSEEKNVVASAPVLKKTSLPSPMNQQPSLPLPHLPPKKKPPKPKKVEPKAEVIYDYQADDEDEISLKSGAHVVILEKIDDSWWKGVNEQGQVGLFPSEYVKEILQTEAQQESQPSSEEVNESSEASVVTTQEEVFTSEPAPASTESPPSSINLSSHDMYEVHNEDSPTLPKTPPPPMRRTTNETPSPTTPNRRSTHESSQAASPKRRSINESTSRRNSSHDGEHVTSRRPPSLVSPDLPPIQSISTNLANIDTNPTSPEERPMVPSRQLSRSSSLYENKTDSQKSPTLAKPPSIPKSFSPAKPPVPPVKRSSSSASKSDKVKTETSPTEPISPKIDRRASHDQYDSSTALSDPENKDDKDDKDDDHVMEDDEQTDEVVEKHEVDKEENIIGKEAEISEEEVVKDDEKVIAETVETKDDEEHTISGHELELEEKISQPQLPPLPSGPKLTSLGKDRPAIKNRKVPSVKNVKEIASQSQTATLLEAVASAKDEAEQKPQPVASPPKPEKPVKPNSFKLPTLGTGVQLRSVPKKPPIETSTESTEVTKDSTIDTRPTGGVKGLSSRFQGVPNSSSDVEFRLKKWFNEEINKVKSQFEAQLAEERSKREALEETLEQLIASLQN